MNNLSSTDYLQYGFYLLVIVLGGIGVKFGIVNVTDVVTLLAGLGIGHGVASSSAKQAIVSNTQALQENTSATQANTVTQPKG